MTAYKKELVDFINAVKDRYTVNDLSLVIAKEFNYNVTPKALRKYYYRHNLSYLKEYERNYNCSFAKPIGSESNPDKNGLIRVKTSAKSWEYKQRYLYKKYYGEIPDGYVVLFLDGNNQNFEKSNLGIAPNRAKLYAQSNGLISKDKNITKVGLLIGELATKSNKK